MSTMKPGEFCCCRTELCENSDRETIPYKHWFTKGGKEYLEQGTLVFKNGRTIFHAEIVEELQENFLGGI